MVQFCIARQAQQALLDAQPLYLTQARFPAKVCYSSLTSICKGHCSKAADSLACALRLTGCPKHTGHTWVLGSPPYKLLQLQNALVCVLSCTCVSMPMTASYLLTCSQANVSCHRKMPMHPFLQTSDVTCRLTAFGFAVTDVEQQVKNDARY